MDPFLIYFLFDALAVDFFNLVSGLKTLKDSAVVFVSISGERERHSNLLALRYLFKLATTAVFLSNAQ